ncbi:TRAP transporter substrate-binding protein [Roseomonas oryzicola]|uniref:TRAP transporter substrate-binding protein n=1 Tax=Neoroseomonas oryzicola TaxID=535904 RepID=A0A9X9WM77_9PROT|nr:TRAP transporter substrate-binding protein [Neoroseomonas oryzicola]NKE19167.1 TRAP transporter substrate-binding protein [Neoroseomonas oryzicola]
MVRSVIHRIASAALLGGFLALLPAFPGAQPAPQGETPIRLKIVGGLADVSQYVRYEEPFWRQHLQEVSGGRLRAEIAPFDRSGIRAQEMLALMRLGVVPFGTVLLAVVSTEEPEFNAVDLPVVNPDMAALRQTIALYRPHLEALLAERYDVELLGIYTYPAQVVFCKAPFSGLSGLAGRRIRTSSVGQSEMFAALGATPVVIPFGETLAALRSGVVECAVTGTLSANSIGLHEVTTHVHAMAITWGLSVFGANRAAWQALPEWARTLIREEVGKLEQEIWQAAEVETGEGLACNTGQGNCATGRRGTMTLVPVSPADETRRLRLLTESVLPGWVRRCGEACVDAWNTRLAPALGVAARND